MENVENIENVENVDDNEPNTLKEVAEWMDSIEWSDGYDPEGDCRTANMLMCDALRILRDRPEEQEGWEVEAIISAYANVVGIYGYN